ncbi:MAG: hypothetical protein IJ561_07710 [Ruminococcus sp.]|nr:hypothetical protein [Ruminococcus sp.]
MSLKIRKLLISVVIASAVNAGSVLLCEYVFHNVTAEVISSTVIGLLWVLYAVIFCRREHDEKHKENS